MPVTPWRYTIIFYTDPKNNALSTTMVLLGNVEIIVDGRWNQTERCLVTRVTTDQIWTSVLVYMS